MITLVGANLVLNLSVDQRCGDGRGGAKRWTEMADYLVASGMGTLGDAFTVKVGRLCLCVVELNS